MQWIFLSSYPSWKSLSLRTKVPGTQVFTNVSEALEWVTNPGFSFPPLGWGRLDLLHNTSSRLKFRSNQWTRDSEVHVAEDAEAASGRRGAVTDWWCSWVLGSELGVIDHLAHSCYDTKELICLARENLPSFMFCGMRSGSYNSEVTYGEVCRFLSKNPN